MVKNDFDKFRKKFNFSENGTAILRCLMEEGEISAGIAAKKTGISIPTVTKTLEGLVAAGIAANCGKRHKEGGRMPVVYQMNRNAAYFAGIEIHHHHITYGICDFNGNIIHRNEKFPFLLDGENSYEELCRAIDDIRVQAEDLWDKVIAATVSIPGRVHTANGESFNYFDAAGKPLSEALEDRFGIKFYIDNDSRVMCYGEYMHRKLHAVKNLLYINLNWGLGMGMILNGKLYYGSTGLSGELGHITMFDNEIFCRCGKKGCLETEASGFAARRLLVAKCAAGAQSILTKKLDTKAQITLDDFVTAIKAEDMLMIEITEEIGSQLGKGVAAMINIFNPEQVIIGGELSKAGDYLKMAVIGSIRKHSLSIVNRETTVELADPSINANLLGCCLIARDRTVGTL